MDVEQVKVDVFWPTAVNSTRDPNSDVGCAKTSLISMEKVASEPNVQTEMPLPWGTMALKYGNPGAEVTLKGLPDT